MFLFLMLGTIGALMACAAGADEVKGWQSILLTLFGWAMILYSPTFLL